MYPSPSFSGLLLPSSFSFWSVFGFRRPHCKLRCAWGEQGGGEERPWEDRGWSTGVRALPQGAFSVLSTPHVFTGQQQWLLLLECLLCVRHGCRHFPCFTSLILTAILWGRFCQPSHFMAVEWRLREVRSHA